MNNLLCLFALFTFLYSSSALSANKKNYTQKTVINCLNPKSWTIESASTLCKTVLDPLKIEKNVYSFIDCSTKTTQHKYEGKLCKKVNIEEQLQMRTTLIQRFIAPTDQNFENVYPKPSNAYFAGMDEVCLDESKKMHQTEKDLKDLTEIIQHYGESGKEAHCVVQAEEDSLAKKSYTASGSRCDELKKQIGKKVILETNNDHICEFTVKPQ